MRAGGAVIAHVPVCDHYKLYDRAQDWLHAAKPPGQTQTLYLQPSRYEVSKKRISPRLALLCHTTATSTQTEQKDFKKGKDLPLQVVESLQLK